MGIRPRVLDTQVCCRGLRLLRKKLGERLVYELVKQGYIYKHFDKMTPSNTMEDHLFRDETKYNYRVRYAITQKARLLVQAFYNRQKLLVSEIKDLSL